MSNSYNYPYNQNNQGNMQADMNRVQSGTYMQNANYMQTNQMPMQMQTGQMPMQMQQMNQMPVQKQQMGQMPMQTQQMQMPVQMQRRSQATVPVQRTTQMPMQMQADMRGMQTGAATAAPVRLPTAPSIAQPLPLTSLAGTPTATSGITPLASSMPRTPGGPQTPVTVASPYYTAGFLKNFIGKNVRVEFLMGTAGAITDRVGTLLEVGASYIVIQPLLTDDLLMCDLYSIRFVTIFK
jgi:hypothetical protein